MSFSENLIIVYQPLSELIIVVRIKLSTLSTQHVDNYVDNYIPLVFFS